MSSSSFEPSRQACPTEEELNQIAQLLRGLRFGSVNIVVQDGVVVQIDRTEKHRVRSPSPSSPRPLNNLPAERMRPLR